MSSFFESIVARSFGVAAVLRPRVPARFEGGGPAGPGPDEVAEGGATRPEPGEPRGRREQPARVTEPGRSSPAVTIMLSPPAGPPPVVPAPDHPVPAPPARELVPPFAPPSPGQVEEGAPLFLAPPPAPLEEPRRATADRMAAPEATAWQPALHRSEAVASRRSEEAGLAGPAVTVEISIGRIELGAPARPQPVAPQPRARSARPGVTLQQYLQRRKGPVP
jgi:hypothetical protein